jgi:phage internal scaffolding protein
MSKKSYAHGSRVFAVGEIFYDHAGNECFFREDGSISCSTVNKDPSMAIQSEKDSCDINLIVARFTKTGLMSNVRTDEPKYGDFRSCVDYHDSILRAQEAQDAFMKLPALIRARFYNDPGKLIDFLADKNNRAEAIKLGLVNAPQDSQDLKGASTPPAADGGKSAPTS